MDIFRKNMEKGEFMKFCSRHNINPNKGFKYMLIDKDWYLATWNTTNQKHICLTITKLKREANVVLM